MRKSFAKHNQALLIGVVRERTARDSIAKIQSCKTHGATAIDLHLSCMDESERTIDQLRSVVNACPLPILALNYNHSYDWKDTQTPEEERIELLMNAIHAGAAAIDLQGYSFHEPSKHNYCGAADFSFTKGNPKEIVTDQAVIDKQRKLIDKIHDMGAEVVISTHPGVFLDCQQVLDLARFLEQRQPDMIKIVTPCQNYLQLAETIKTQIVLEQEIKTPVHYHSSGKAGRLSRIVNPILGGHMIFCSNGFTPNANFEQTDLATTKIALDALNNILL